MYIKQNASMCVTNVSVYQDGTFYTNNAFYYTPYHDYKFDIIPNG